MEGILRGIPHVSIYIDDTVTGETDEEHLRNLEVFTKLDNENVCLKRERCEFMPCKVEYLGRNIFADGLQPSLSKIKPIQDAPAPRNVLRLRSFLLWKIFASIVYLLASLYQLL